MTTLFDTDAPFVAWRRPAGNRKWVAVAGGATEAEASRALHKFLRTASGSGDSIVLPVGRTPSDDLPQPGLGGPSGRHHARPSGPTPRTPRRAVFHGR